MIKSTIRTSAVCLSAAVLLSGLGSCKKSAAEKSKAELLTQSAWKIVKGEEKTGAGAWTDYTGSLSPCEKDNNIVFRNTGTFEINEGATKCNSTDPQISETGAWSLDGTILKITYTGSSSADNSTVEQLDENTLLISSSFSAGGTTYYDRSTYSH